MQKIQSTERINQLQTQVEQQLKLAVGVLQNLDENVLAKPSTTGGWSILQCLDHLNSYGQYYLPWITKAIEESRGHSLWFTHGWLGGYLTQMMEPHSPRKYKAFKGHLPATNLEAYAVISEFISQLETLLTLLETSRSSDLNSRVIPISIVPFIRLKTGDVFGFLVAHIQRHLEQAQRNLI